jgi:hypothetical protein
MIFCSLLFLSVSTAAVTRNKRQSVVDADADAAATAGAHTIPRQWQEFMMFATHEASADPPVQARDLFHFSAVLFVRLFKRAQ